MPNRIFAFEIPVSSRGVPNGASGGGIRPDVRRHNRSNIVYPLPLSDLDVSLPPEQTLVHYVTYRDPNSDIVVAELVRKLGERKVFYGTGDAKSDNVAGATGKLESLRHSSNDKTKWGLQRRWYGRRHDGLRGDLDVFPEYAFFAQLISDIGSGTVPITTDVIPDATDLVDSRLAGEILSGNYYKTVNINKLQQDVMTIYRRYLGLPEHEIVHD